MKLQAKFALYNAITKVGIILVLGVIILLSIDKISTNHLDNRLNKKRLKIVENLNEEEIQNLLQENQTFTDYNILKDEFIVLNVISKKKALNSELYFSTEHREIEGYIEVYRILSEEFEYNGQRYQLEIGESMTAMEAIKNTVGFYMLIVLSLAIFVTLIIDFAFTHYLLKPFYKIIDQKINKVNDPISYNYNHIPTTTKDFKILDNSINSLMQKLSGLFLLEKQFIANVSHELLTPISVLSTRLENILADEGLSEQHENKIVSSLKTLNRLKVIINSLLLISKIENEQYVKHDQISIKTEIEEIYEELEDRIIGKNIIFENHITTDFVFKGSQPLIRTLLINVINNAIKYNRIGGKISIDAEKQNHQYLLHITDTGIGMNAEEIKKAFERFERVKNEHEEGFGLGLAIVNSIAKFHNLKLNIESVKDSHTLFTITFSII